MRLWLVVALLAVACTSETGGTDGGGSDGTAFPSDVAIVPDAGMSGDAGSGQDSGSAPDASPREVLTEICAQTADAICGASGGCDCVAVGSYTAEECAAQYRRVCERRRVTPEAIDAIERGVILLHEEAAARVYEDLSSLGCAGYAGWRWTVREHLQHGGLFEGTLPSGASCTIPHGMGLSECASGLCDGGSTSCADLVPVGATCSATSTPTCVDFDEVIDFSDKIGAWERQFGGACVPLAPGAATGTCQVDREDGESCTKGYECRSERCVAGICAARLEVGASCAESRECLSGHCAASTATPTCQLGELPHGAACTGSRTQCATNDCWQGHCVNGICNLF